MVSKENPGVWLDLDAAANDNDPIPSGFGEGSGRAVDPHILEIARILAQFVGFLQEPTGIQALDRL